MKKVKFYNYILYIAVLLLFILFAFPPTFAYADDEGDYRFSVTKYDAIYDISADRSMKVCEEITVLYEGYDSTGFIRDIPVNAGDRVKNISVSETTYGSEQSVPYSVYIEFSDFVSVDIGDYSKKRGQTHTYKIEYDYIITKPVNKNAIYLNAIGYGWESTINDVSVLISLPQGFIANQTEYFIGNTTNSSNNFSVTGNTVTASVDHLNYYSGLTFNFYFEDGVLYTKTDVTPYLILIVGVILVAILIVLKLLVFKNKPLTPVVNFTAPDDMDPLVMGKYIDNTVNSEDITSLIFYWADKGFLKINMDDEDDPVLIRLVTKLPENFPEHQKIMFARLFSTLDCVKISSLTNTFYTTVDVVKRKINETVKGLYTTKSTVASGIVALLGALFICLIPLVFAFINLSGYIYGPSLIAIIPAVFVYLMALVTYYNKNKYKKSRYILGYVFAALIALGGTAFYCFTINAATVEYAALIVACIIGYGIVIASVSLICRTDGYTQKLNHIIGFKNFILYTEKDRLEAMLKETPQLYYHILPYAQVLGVTNIWEEKFESLTLAPPNWMIYSNNSFARTYFEVRIINRAIRRASTNMTRSMVSRPSSSGRSRGGGFGGGGGGGHGGGGGRGR